MLSEHLKSLMNAAGIDSPDQIADSANALFRKWGGFGDILPRSTLRNWLEGRSSGRYRITPPENPRHWEGVVAFAYVVNANEENLKHLLNDFKPVVEYPPTAKKLWEFTEGEEYKKKHRPGNTHALQTMLRKWYEPGITVVQTAVPSKAGNRVIVFVLIVSLAISGSLLGSIPAPYCELIPGHLQADYPPIDIRVCGAPLLWISVYSQEEITISDWQLLVDLSAYQGICQVGDQGATVFGPQDVLTVFPELPDLSRRYSCEKSVVTGKSASETVMFYDHFRALVAKYTLPTDAKSPP